jgi:hypothetical protein
VKGWIAISTPEDVVDMRRYLLVLDTDLLAFDEKLDLEPINYLVEQQARQPCEVVVLSLVDTGQSKRSALELLLGGATSHAAYAPAKFPTAPRPDHDEDLVKAVDAETRSHEYDEVILATSGHEGSWLARSLHLDPAHHLQRRWGKQLTVFAIGPDNKLDH